MEMWLLWQDAKFSLSMAKDQAHCAFHWAIRRGYHWLGGVIW